jgi:hypothetical protein
MRNYIGIGVMKHGSSRGTTTLNFFRVENGRKRKQTIFSLKDGERTVIGNEKLLELASNYYKTLWAWHWESI